MAEEKQAFIVRHEEAQLLVPAKPTPHEIKHLSDLDDQKGMRFHLPVIVFYRANPLMKAKDPVKVVREALAQALVWYYPFAGRLIQGPKDKFMVDCATQGILFIEANGDFSINDLGDAIKPPCLYSKELLFNVPGSDAMLGCPLMSVQVTRLICGGFVVAIRINHVLTDGLGLVHFLKAVGELAQGASSPSVKPVWKREVLTATYLPPRTTFEHPEYDVVGRKDESSVDPIMDHFNAVSGSFFFGPKEIKAIRQKLPPHTRPCSKFDLITACIWRSRTRALKLDGDETISIACMVNVSNKGPLALLNGYYGNAAVSPAAVTKASILCFNPLGYAIELIQKAKGKVSEDYVRSVINFIDLKGRPPVLRSRRNFVVTDASRLRFNEVDFGWGKPLYGGTMEGGSATLSIYACYRNSDGEDGVVVPVFLPPLAMKRFEEEMKRLTSLELSEISEKSNPFLKSNI